MKPIVCAWALLALLATSVQAAENPTGTWKWTREFNGKTRESSLKLELKDGKLTGSMPGRDNTERAIEEAAFANDEVSFKITRERDGQKFTTKYTGKVSGDTIKGKIEFERGGQARSVDWEAKRS